MNIFELPERMS